jgi:hypothetical protein
LIIFVKRGMYKACAATLIATAMSRVTSSSSKADLVDFQTFELDGEIQDMMWCGANDETILLHTKDGSIYRSRDRGGNWKRLKSLMAKQGALVADESQEVINCSRLSEPYLSVDWKGAQDDAESE